MVAVKVPSPSSQFSFKSQINTTEHLPDERSDILTLTPCIQILLRKPTLKCPYITFVFDVLAEMKFVFSAELHPTHNRESFRETHHFCVGDFGQQVRQTVPPL
ncbi:hypothetical protein XENOCAPTIV_015519 [Xenoophorus captivus]|uniref:Uncharacterized protein n=1 Tax=Xenoophorus captivus TaxID=1517983 RepID=A0ABV0Q586_9TELE